MPWLGLPWRAQKLKQADERLAALETELKWAKSEADKKSLFKGAKEGAGVQGLNDRSTNDDYLKEARKLQDKTEGALQNALEMVEATKKVRAPCVRVECVFHVGVCKTSKRATGWID